MGRKMAVAFRKEGRGGRRERRQQVGKGVGCQQREPAGRPAPTLPTTWPLLLPEWRGATTVPGSAWRRWRTFGSVRGCGRAQRPTAGIQEVRTGEDRASCWVKHGGRQQASRGLCVGCGRRRGRAASLGWLKQKA